MYNMADEYEFDNSSGVILILFLKFLNYLDCRCCHVDSSCYSSSLDEFS
jgi:hypothetical protein